ncbi:hypothetical protein HK101_000375, partial [Irineochytrium annulatum]
MLGPVSDKLPFQPFKEHISFNGRGQTLWTPLRLGFPVLKDVIRPASIPPLSPFSVAAACQILRVLILILLPQSAAVSVAQNEALVVGLLVLKGTSATSTATLAAMNPSTANATTWAPASDGVSTSWRNREFFNRISMKLILAICVANAGTHAAYIYSLYFSDEANCCASVYIYIFTSLLACFLTTALAVNLVVISVLKRKVFKHAFAVYLLASVVASATFALPPVVTNVIG